MFDCFTCGNHSSIPLCVLCVHVPAALMRCLKMVRIPILIFSLFWSNFCSKIPVNLPENEPAEMTSNSYTKGYIIVLNSKSTLYSLIFENFCALLEYLSIFLTNVLLKNINVIKVTKIYFNIFQITIKWVPLVVLYKIYIKRLTAVLQTCTKLIY